MEGPSVIVFTTCGSQIFSNNVFGIVSILCGYPRQFMQVFFTHFFFCIGHPQKFNIENVNFISAEVISDFVQAVGQCTSSAAGGEYDFGAVGSHFFRVYDLIGLCIFQETILVYTG